MKDGILKVRRVFSLKHRQGCILGLELKSSIFSIFSGMYKLHLSLYQGPRGRQIEQAKLNCVPYLLWMKDHFCFLLKEFV